MPLVKNNIEGSRKSAYHDFVIEQQGMQLSISSGSYYAGGKELFLSENGVTLDFNSPTMDTHYQIWINDLGAVLLERLDGEAFASVDNWVTKLAWFTIPANTTTLDGIDINVIEYREVS